MTSGKLMRVYYSDEEYSWEIVFPRDLTIINKVVIPLSIYAFQHKLDSLFLNFNKHYKLYEWLVYGTIYVGDEKNKLFDIMKSFFVMFSPASEYAVVKLDIGPITKPGSGNLIISDFLNLVHNFFDDIDVLTLKKRDALNGDIWGLFLAPNRFSIIGEFDALRFTKSYLEKNGIVIEETNETLRW